MRFKYTVKEDLPPLSWLAFLSRDDKFINVIVGSAVEKFDGFFVSGAWDGVFELGGFDKCNHSCCTGAKLVDDKVVFATPHHLNACIYSIQEKESICLSNSLSFLLAYTGENLDADHYLYDTDFCCEALGERNLKFPYYSTTPLRGEKQLMILSFTKIFIDKSLNLRLERRASDFNFTSFQDYYDSLVTTLKLIDNNIDNPKRKCRYGKIATISRGYDAPTCAVLAREIGCEEVFTFNRPIHYENDCGTDIAKAIGYKKIHECDGDFVKSNTEFIEAADFASGDSGAMITFEGYKDLFKDKLLFMGFCGDEFWGIDHPPYENLKYPIEGSNSNSYEVFLQSNTFLILIPYIGADHAKQIYEISMSEDMRPWRLGVKYDRPICRRIIEESGVERSMFGQKKVGAGFCFHYDTLKSIGKKLSPQSYQSLTSFAKHLKQNPIKKVSAYCRYYYYNSPVYLSYILSKFHIKYWKGPLKKGHLSNPVSTTYILWGIDIMIQRYLNALGEK